MDGSCLYRMKWIGVCQLINCSLVENFPSLVINFYYFRMGKLYKDFYGKRMGSYLIQRNKIILMEGHSGISDYTLSFSGSQSNFICNSFYFPEVLYIVLSHPSGIFFFQACGEKNRIFLKKGVFGPIRIKYCNESGAERIFSRFRKEN